MSVTQGISMRWSPRFAGARTHVRQATEAQIFYQGLRPLHCACGWCGKVADLVAEKPEPNGFGPMGPGFPVCPRCHSDEELHRDD